MPMGEIPPWGLHSILHITHTGPHTGMCPGTCHTRKHTTPITHTCSHIKCASTQPMQGACTARQNQERDGGEELSPQMPGPFLGSLQKVAKDTDGLSSLAILHKPWPECSKKAGKCPFRNVVPDLPGQPPALCVTSLK